MVGFHRHQNRRGFTMVEAVLAGFLAVLFVAVAANTIPLAVGTAERGRLQARATNLAASALAEERQQDFVHLEPGERDLPPQTLEGTSFRTRVSVAAVPGDPRLKDVKVRVSWTDRAGPRSILLEGPVVDVRR